MNSDFYEVHMRKLKSNLGKVEARLFETTCEYEAVQLELAKEKKERRKLAEATRLSQIEIQRQRERIKNAESQA